MRECRHVTARLLARQRDSAGHRGVAVKSHTSVVGLSEVGGVAGSSWAVDQKGDDREGTGLWNRASCIVSRDVQVVDV